MFYNQDLALPVELIFSPAKMIFQYFSAFD